MPRVYAGVHGGSSTLQSGPHHAPASPTYNRPMTPERARCLEALARLILRVERPHPLRVAIDGPDAAGKTILADELAPLLEGSGRSVVRATVDGFHRPQAGRYARGSESPEGYFFDSFDYSALRASLLDPLGPDGNRH